jgi:hypothetical protein
MEIFESFTPYNKTKETPMRILYKQGDEIQRAISANYVV